MQTFTDLHDGLIQGYQLDVKSDGNIYKISWLSRLWEWITRSKNKRIDRLQSLAERILLKAESERVEPSVEMTKRIFTYLNRKGDYLIHAMQVRQMNPPSPKELDEKLKAQALEWKKKEEVLDERELTLNDLERLKIASHYPEFLKLINTDEKLRDRFFSWSLRYRLPPLIFIAFPGLTERLIISRLHDQLGSDEGAHLKVDVYAKKVTLLFEGNKEINLLNENETVNLGSHFFTVKQVLADFQESEFRPMALRYFPKLDHPDPKHTTEGVCYWPKAKVATLIDLKKEAFWKDLRPVRRKTPKEASDFFKTPLDGKQWAVGVMATQSFKEPNFRGNHALLVIGVPMEDGIYTIYPIGKFPPFYMRDSKDLIKLMFEYVDAELIYPDDNIDMHDREHVVLGKSCDEKEGILFFNKVRDDWLKPMVFHLGTKNCCHWAEKRFRGFCPNTPPIFKASFFDMTPHPKLKPLFKWIKNKKWIHHVIFNVVSYFLGGTVEKSIEKEGKKKSYSILGTRPWSKDEGFYAAAKLFERIHHLREAISG